MRRLRRRTGPNIGSEMTSGGWESETDCYEGHGRVNRAWDVACWIPHLSGDVIGLVETIKRPESGVQSLCIRGCCRLGIDGGIWIRISCAAAKEAVA
jgi:hypothetical protein